MRINVKKYLRFLVMLILTLSLFSLGSSAATEDKHERGWGEEIDGIIDSFRDILPEGRENLADAGGALSALGFDALLYELAAALSGSTGRIAAFLSLVIGIGAAVALSGLVDGDNAPLCRSGVALVCSFALISALMPAVSEALRALRDCSRLFESLIPIISTVTALGGAEVTAATGAVGMSLTLGFATALSDSMLPLVATLFIAGALSSFVGDGLSLVVGSVRSLFVRGVGLLTAVIGGTVALQTMISTATDSAAMRAARYAVSGAVPAVGAAVSGALATLAGGLSYLKGVVGGGAVACIILSVLAPLVTLLLYKGCLFLLGCFLDFLGVSEGKRCVEPVSRALDALISMLAMCSLIFVFEIVVFIKEGSAL